MQITPINTTNNNLNKTKCPNNFKCRVILLHTTLSPGTMIKELYNKLPKEQQDEVKILMKTLMNIAPYKEIILPTCNLAIIAKKGFWNNYLKNKAVDYDSSKDIVGLMKGNLNQFFNELIEFAKKYDNPNKNESILNLKNKAVDYKGRKKIEGQKKGNLKQIFNKLIEFAKKYDNPNKNESILNHCLFVNG